MKYDMVRVSQPCYKFLSIGEWDKFVFERDFGRSVLISLYAIVFRRT